MKTISSSLVAGCPEGRWQATRTRVTLVLERLTAISKSMPCSGDVIRVRTRLPGEACRLEAGLRKRVLVDCLPDARQRVTVMRLNQSGW